MLLQVLSRILSNFSKLCFISLLGVLVACGGDGFNQGSDGGSSDDIVLTELSKSTTQPAVVSVSFKARTRLGEPVASLTIENFVLEENGETISISEAIPNLSKEPDEFIYSTLLLMDLSGSVLQNSFDNLVEAATSFVTSSFDRDGASNGSFQVKLAYFDGRENIIPLTEYTSSSQELISALESLTQDVSLDNSTNLHGAILQGISDLDAEVDTFNIEGMVSAGSLVVFTDGNDQAARVSLDDAQTAVDEASDSLSIFTIGLEGELNTNVLDQLGRDGTTFATDLTELVAAFDTIAGRIIDEANSIYIFRYCSPKRSGDENELTINVEKERQRGSLTTTFSAVGFTGGCSL